MKEFTVAIIKYGWERDQSPGTEQEALRVRTVQHRGTNYTVPEGQRHIRRVGHDRITMYIIHIDKIDQALQARHVKRNIE